MNKRQRKKNMKTRLRALGELYCRILIPYAVMAGVDEAVYESGNKLSEIQVTALKSYVLTKTKSDCEKSLKLLRRI
jgi:hypothetical protein